MRGKISFFLFVWQNKSFGYENMLNIHVKMKVKVHHEVIKMYLNKQ